MIDYVCPRGCGCNPKKLGMAGKNGIFRICGKEWVGLQAFIESRYCRVKDLENMRGRLKRGNCMTATAEEARKSSDEKRGKTLKKLGVKGRAARWGKASDRGPLTDAKVIAIRESKLSPVQIAQREGLDPSAVRRIISGDTYRNVRKLDTLFQTFQRLPVPNAN